MANFRNKILSKSDFMLYLKHPAWLWLKKHQPEVLPKIDEATQTMFDNGHEFENLIEGTYKNAVKIGFSKDMWSYNDMPKKTWRALKSGAHVVLQGRIESDNLTCIFDVLEKIEGGNFSLTEIKSSTKVKEEHILDLAFQKIVLESVDIKIDKVMVRFVDSNYLRGDKLEPEKLSVLQDVTDLVSQKIEFVSEKIKSAQEVLISNVPPDMSPRHSSDFYLSEWLKIYETLYPPESKYHIFRLTGIKPDLLGKLQDLQISLIKEIPENVDLTEKQKKQFLATKNGSPVIDNSKIKEFVDQCQFPLYFFDYETFSQVMPPFKKSKPYEQIPFQYSLHILHSNGSLVHREFLHDNNSDPREQLLSQLKKDIGKEGSIISWYKVFESTVNKNLSEYFPEFSDFLNDINNRMIDLMDPFKQDFYIHKDFYGSASIKKVLPVLISELSYENLAIKEGATASRLWADVIMKGKFKAEKEKILENLKQYCGTDTLAMVKIYEHLKNV